MAPSKKPVLHPLKTPKSITFPSELRDREEPNSSDANKDAIKQEDGSATPISPPIAYTEFLKALTPVFTSPVSAGVSFPSFTFDATLHRLPASVPSSATSTSFSAAEGPKGAYTSIPSASPVATPHSAKTPGALRRLRIPTSLAFSPSAESPQSGNALRSPFSPADWKLRYLESPRSATGKPVSVRQVVTRTVTYKRTPLDPPPKGKRRKVNDTRET